MERVPKFLARTTLNVTQAINRLSLRWKIYLSLTAILFPVFSLTIFIQTQVTTPFLEEEAREIGISVCRSLSSDIASLRLMSKPEELESRLIEATWQQPSVVRIDVLAREPGAATPGTTPANPTGASSGTAAPISPVGTSAAPAAASSGTVTPPPVHYKLVATNVVDDNPIDISNLVLDDTPRTERRRPGEKDSYWEIVYPIRDKSHRKPIGYVHAEVSLQLVHQLVGTFSRIAFLGAFLAIGLLIGLLSYYLRRMIENERRLRVAESENIDLTQQLHETQRQLFLNEKLAVMGQLTASFAHEIGTPLNSLSGHLQLLRDEAAESCRPRIGIINSQVTRIEGIVKDFLASTHEPHQQRQLVAIKDLVERIAKLVAPRISGIKAQVKIEIPDDSIEPLRIVPTDLEQVLLNLTNNAIDALEASPATSTTPRELVYQARTVTEGSRRWLELIVRDTGQGIAPAALKQVLKPFYTTKPPGQGTGLGLPISQRLIKRYGGRLELESELGKGTTIKVSIPYDAA